MAAPASEGVRVRVSAVILVDGRLVLVRHRRGDRAYHLLPGGGVEAGETMPTAVAREVLEETGLVVTVGRPVFLSDSIDPVGSRHVVNVAFLATVAGGGITERPTDERVEAVDLVEPSALPSLDLRPPVAEALVRAIDTGFSGELAYLGSPWIDEPAS